MGNCSFKDVYTNFAQKNCGIVKRYILKIPIASPIGLSFRIQEQHWHSGWRESQWKSFNILSANFENLSSFEVIICDKWLSYQVIPYLCEIASIASPLPTFTLSRFSYLHKCRWRIPVRIKRFSHSWLFDHQISMGFPTHGNTVVLGVIQRKPVSIYFTESEFQMKPWCSLAIPDLCTDRFWCWKYTCLKCIYIGTTCERKRYRSEFSLEQTACGAMLSLFCWLVLNKGLETSMLQHFDERVSQDYSWYKNLFLRLCYKNSPVTGSGG